MTETKTLPEQLENQRSKWLILNLLGFVLWDGMRILDHYVFPTVFGAELSVFVGVVSAMGAFIFYQER